MKQKIAQMRLIRYLFTAVLALLFVSWNKGRSSDEPKPSHIEQTTSSKQVEDKIGFRQREVTLHVGEIAKVTLQGARSPRIETSNSNLVEATLVEQRTAVSLKGLQAGEGAIKVFSGNRYAELRVIVKATNADSNNSLNGKNIVWDEISPDDYELSADGLTLTWKNTSTQNLDMNRDTNLSKIRFIKVLAFWECSNLTNINIPSSVTNIEEAAFYGCRSLASVNIPNSITSIGEWAFSGCESLTSITIPSSITSIEERAFVGCRNLTSVVFEGSTPPRVTKITDMFENTPNNLKLIVPKGAKNAYIKAGYPEDKLVEQ